MWTQEQKREYQRKWREENPEKVKAKTKKWRAANKERVKAQKRAWHAANKEKINVAAKKSRDENKDKINEQRKRYIASLSPAKKELLKKDSSARAKIRCRKRKIRAVEFLGGKCKSCGLVDCPAIYDFHHRDPSTKEARIAQLCKKPWSESIEAELGKCDLLCANCHRKIHYLGVLGL